MQPKVIELPDGEWAIASDGEWPNKGRSYWTGKAAQPWCSNMGKALVFETFRGADMELKMLTAAKEGSYLENNRMPKVGDKVFILAGQMSNKVMAGEITKVSNIDQRGLGNTYVDVLGKDGKTHHINVAQLYDHKPKRKKVTDKFGETTVWANTGGKVSKAQTIAKLVEAGHEDLADTLVNLVTGKSLHISVKELPNELQKALKQVGFRKQDIEVIAADKYTMFGAGSQGRKDFTMAVNLKTGKTQLEEGSWGGANPFVKNPVDLDDKPRRLPPDFAVIKGSRGSGPTWARILVHPSNLASLLPTKEDDSMPKEELACLAIISGIKGGQYRRDEFSRYPQLGEYGPNNGHIKSLLNKGMVKIAKNGGISITTKGKNVNPGYQKLYSLMKG